MRRRARRRTRASLVLLIASALVLQACGGSDLVESRYATLADAQADHAIERGYLPPWLPGATGDVRTIGDMDTGWFAIAFVVPEPGRFQTVLEANGFRRISGELPPVPAEIRSWKPAPDPAGSVGYHGTHGQGNEPVVLILDRASGVVQYWRE